LMDHRQSSHHRIVTKRRKWLLTLIHIAKVIVLSFTHKSALNTPKSLPCTVIKLKKVTKASKWPPNLFNDRHSSWHHHLVNWYSTLAGNLWIALAYCLLATLATSSRPGDLASY
jgi:hypothetical protein